MHHDTWKTTKKGNYGREKREEIKGFFVHPDQNG
jgi:hypothetical protein